MQHHQNGEQQAHEKPHTNARNKSRHLSKKGLRMSDAMSVLA